MEVEAIVINGKRYTPCKGASCAECDLRAHCGKDLITDLDHNAVCDIFKRDYTFALKTADKIKSE